MKHGIHICLIVAMLLVQGCAINSATETVKIPIRVQGQIVEAEYTSQIWQGLFLYWTKSKQIDHRTEFSSLEIGEIESTPDANSIDAMSDSLGGILLKGLK